jgi:hypothetical protein
MLVCIESTKYKCHTFIVVVFVYFGLPLVLKSLINAYHASSISLVRFKALNSDGSGVSLSFEFTVSEQSMCICLPSFVPP